MDSAVVQTGAVFLNIQNFYATGLQNFSSTWLIEPPENQRNPYCGYVIVSVFKLQVELDDKSLENVLGHLRRLSNSTVATRTDKKKRVNFFLFFLRGKTEAAYAQKVNKECE